MKELKGFTGMSSSGSNKAITKKFKKYKKNQASTKQGWKFWDCPDKGGKVALDMFNKSVGDATGAGCGAVSADGGSASAACGESLAESVSLDIMKDALEYYKENAYGYSGIEDYVDTDFQFHSDEDKKKIINYIKSNGNYDNSNFGESLGSIDLVESIDVDDIVSDFNCNKLDNEDILEDTSEYKVQLENILNDLSKRLENLAADEICSRPKFEDGIITLACTTEPLIRSEIRKIILDTCNNTKADIEDEGDQIIILFKSQPKVQCNNCEYSDEDEYLDRPEYLDVDDTPELFKSTIYNYKDNAIKSDDIIDDEYDSYLDKYKGDFDEEWLNENTQPLTTDQKAQLNTATKSGDAAGAAALANQFVIQNDPTKKRVAEQNNLTIS